MKIPLSKVYMDDEIKEAVLKALDKDFYILGEESERFEQEFAKIIGVKYSVLTSSGTSAIKLSLLALGIKEGDDVIVPSLTAFPTVEPLLQCGAKPVFVDVDGTYTIDPLKIEQNINDRTVGIMPVHLYGHPANLEIILEVAGKHHLFVLEDCCQAHNAKFNYTNVGSFGIAGCFSFYPSKNMTVCGDGGIVTTNDIAIADKIRKLRDHGRQSKYVHEIIGFNDRFNEIQAAIGRVQLKKLDWFTDRRREIAKIYTERLKGLPVVTPYDKEGSCHVYHLFVIRLVVRETKAREVRDKLMGFLKQKGIATGIHYPVPCHLQPAIKDRCVVSNLYFTEKYSNEILSLPIYPLLKDEEVDYICESIKEFFK